MAESEMTRRLRLQIQRLLESQTDDARLRDNLEGLAHDAALPGLTWYWGPALYDRNRAMFRPFILNHFATWNSDGKSWSRVRWQDHADCLEGWLASARRCRDTTLVRRLLGWKVAGKSWGIDAKAWNGALIQAYSAASGAAARAMVLDEFDFPAELTEDTAILLYRIDRSAAPFLLRHLKLGFWGNEKRALWSRLATAAESAGDEELRWSLYRKQVPLKQWQSEVVALARQISDPQTLNQELDRRHPEGWGNLDRSGAAIKLLESRGREVLPYVRSHLVDLLGGWYANHAKPLIEIAERHGWWDLWSAVLRSQRDPALYNKAIEKLLGDASLSDDDRQTRLRALAGASREWNWPGFGLAVVHALKDDLATRLYRQYPALVHGPFKAHVTPTWWQGYPQLLAAAQQSQDDELVDILASRYATRPRWDYAWTRKQTDPIVDTADRLADDYQALRDRDPSQFARRAANVLTRIPAYSIRGYAQLLRTNKLARLLFVRSFEEFLAAPEAVRDLVEGSDIHVQMLAYRILALDDDRARELAEQSLDILLGTLLRPLHRKTRLAAFGALANAARTSLEAARRVHDQAREAWHLPDRKYPKEELIGLLGEVLRARPELRGPREQPVIFRKKVCP